MRRDDMVNFGSFGFAVVITIIFWLWYATRFSQISNFVVDDLLGWLMSSESLLWGYILFPLPVLLGFVLFSLVSVLIRKIGGTVLRSHKSGRQ